MARWLIGIVLLGSLGSARGESTAPCKPAAPSSKLTVSFAGDTAITDLVTWVVGFTCKNVVMDADAKARVPKVSVVAAKPLTPKQALQLFVDAVEATGLSVKQKPDTIIISLGPKLARDCAVATSTSAPTPGAGASSSAAAAEPSDELAKLLDTGITKRSDTDYVVSKKIVEAVLANPTAVAKGARVVPAVKDGKPDGFKIYAIRPSSFYARIGLQNGDTLQKINGFEVTSADKALEVYSSLRDATTFAVSLSRRGKPVLLTITVK